MKILKQFKKVSLFFLLLSFLSASAFAQTYVSATDGDDGVAGLGTMAAPYATLTKALANTAAGGTIIIEPGTYTAATTTVTKAFVIQANDFGSNGGTAVIMKDLVLNMTTATDVLSFGETGMPFNIDNLTLTKGVMNIATANVVMASATTITRTAGSLNNTPTITNVNVLYNGTVDLASGAELPSNLGTGSLTVNITAGKLLTVGSNVTAATVTVTTGNVDFSNVTSAGAVAVAAGNVSFVNLTSNGAVTVTSGNTTVTGTLTLNKVALTNNGTGNVTLGNVAVNFGANIANTINNASNGNLTVNGTLSFVHDGVGVASTWSGLVNNAGTGTVTLAQGFTTSAASGDALQISLNNASSGKLIANGAVAAYDVDQAASAGTITLTGGSASNSVDVGAGGIVDLAANFTISGTVANTNSGTIKVNSNTLSFTGAAATLVGAGKVISTTAAIVGAGSVDFTKAITVTQAELPNVTVSGAAGKVTLGSDVNVYGNFVLASPVAGALTDATFNLSVYGNFTRTDNTLGNVVSTGTLSMRGAGNAVITAGTQLSLKNVIINKDALATTVDLTASLIINGAFTITTGTVELNTYHIRMQTGATTFTNGSGGYNSDGGYLIIEANTSLAGAGVYSNIDIRGTSTAAVTAPVLKFSGILHITDGVLAVGANTFTFVNDLVTTPDVFIHTDGPGTMTVGIGAVNTESASVFYNLTYTGVGNAVAGAEWIAAGINDLNIYTGGAVPAANTVTGFEGNSTVAGNLTVALAQILQIGDDGVGTDYNLTLSGDGAPHSVVGQILGGAGGLGKIIVTGNAASIAGSTSATAVAEIPNLDVTILAAESFTSANLKKITGNLTAANGTSTINMNTTTANITGNVTLLDGALNLNMASTASAHGGNIVVTKGAVVYTRGSVAAQQIIGGAVTLTDGSLTLGSSVSVTGLTSQVAGNLILGANNYTAKTANYTRTGAGTLTGTGSLIVGGITLAPGVTFQVPNLVLDGAVTIGAAMEVTNSLTHTSGAVNYNNLTFSGNTYLFKAGSIAGAFVLTGSAVNATFEADVIIPTLTINSVGSVDFKSNNTIAKTVTVNTAFTQTKGDLNLGINTLAVTTAFTNVAGNITQTTGYLNLNVAAPVVANGFTIDNLNVLGAGNFGTKTFTVVKNLKLTAGTVTTSAVDKLVLGDGIVITRTAGDLAEVPKFGTSTNLVYNGDAAITAAKEQPATVNNYTIIDPVGGGVTNVTLAADVTVTGTLSIAGVLTQGAKKATMANGSTLELLVAGTTAIAGKDLTRTGSMDLIYGAAVTTSSRELGTLAGDAFPTFTGNVTVKGNLTLNQDVTIDGKLLLNGGNIVFVAAGTAGDQITLLGNFEEKAGEWFITNNGTVVLGGVNNTEFKLSANKVITANSKILLNKTNANSVVTLTGGDLDFATNAIDLTLTNGVLQTVGAYKVILKQSNTGIVTNQPKQGFTRTNGVVAGNVSKFVDKTKLVDISKVEYPTGSILGEYRPAVFYFKIAPQSSINLSVNHDEVSPGGINGIPMTLPTQVITNYPDLFWYVKSDIALAPSYTFDLEFQAEGYNDYILDGIENVRMIRRDSGNVANNWILQGADGNYDNSTIAANWPLVKVIDATGGITQQGSKFTFSQSNKAPVVTKTAKVNNVAGVIVANGITIAEVTDKLELTYVVTDPDINDAATTTAVVPTGATWNAATKVMTWTPTYSQSGVHYAVITATDTYNQVTVDSFKITVTNTNIAPVFTAAPVGPVSVAENVAYRFTYAATDADGDAITYSYVLTSGTAPDSISLGSTTGLLTIIPKFGEMGNTFSLTVTATDVNAGKVDSLTAFVVVKTNRAPAFVNEMNDTTIAEGQALAYTYTATDLDLNTLTFSLSADAPAGATIDSTTGAFAWTPGYTQAGVHTFSAIVKDNGTPNMVDSSKVTVTVTDLNAPPTWVKVLPNTTIFVGDKLTFKYVAKDLDLDKLTFTLDVPKPAALTIVATDDTSATIEWTPIVADTASYLIGMKATDGITTISTSAIVVVKVTTVDVSGVVSYNVSGELLNGVTVTLSDGVTSVTKVTAANGAYTFTGVNPGAYTVTAAKTTQWGGALASDALETQLYVVNPAGAFLATDLQKLAADVVGVGNITSSDALAILNRSVGINTFQVADWLFESKSITTGNSNVIVNLKGIAAGDARSDYNPNASLAKASSIAVNSEEVLNIKKESEFSLPISISELSEVGSYTMKLKYASDKVEFLGASTSNGGMFVSNAVDGVISIAWINTDSKEVKVNEGAALATLKFKATEQFSKTDEVSLELLDGAELTNGLAKNINANINIPVVAIGIPDVFALRQNYPNPFNPSTTIQYDLPEDGKVTLTIYNSLGQTVGTLVNTKQVAGAYDVKFNASNLSSGVYLYRVTVEGTKNFVMTKKMILMK